MNLSLSEKRAKARRRYAGIAMLALALMAAAALLLGHTLGSFFAGMVIAFLILPYIVRPRDDGNYLSVACVTDSVAMVWLILVVSDPQLGLWNWLAAYAILLSVALSQWGLLLLLRLYLGAAANAVAILLLLAWLAAPLWFLHQLPAGSPWLQRLIDVHPLFAMNAVVPVSVWTESPASYTLMNLNQDVPYAMPAGPWLAIALHVVIGATMCLIWIKAARGRPR